VIKNVIAVIAVSSMASTFAVPGQKSALGTLPAGARRRPRHLGTTLGIDHRM
jgi:Ni/Co efflux regulator RcnB